MGVSKAYINKAIEKIKNDKEILPENKKLILDFQRHLEVNDYSENRQYKYLITLPKLAKQLNKPFDKATKEDIEKLILWVKRRKNINENTKLHYKILLKRFYKWIGNGEYPECVKFITTTEKNNNKKLPEHMLTKKDIKKLIEAANNPRDQAFISMLWETGARIDEILKLKVGDLEDHKYGMKVIVEGKTGSRRLILIQSVPYINVWLKSHPNRNKDAPLWTNIGTKNHGGPIEYRAILKMLNNVAKKAGIKKPVNPHNFRHSRATYMANHFTEAQMCEWFGWVQGSKVPARYVHLSGRDIDNAYARMHGIKENEEEEEEEVEFIKCPRCDYNNASTFKYCGRCGMALDLKTAMESEDKDRQLGASLVEILKDPDIAKEITELLIKKAIEKNPEMVKEIGK